MMLELHRKLTLQGKSGLSVKQGLLRKLGLHSKPGMGERSYAYAKACGIIGKSFTGKRVKLLENAAKLSELDRIVFPLGTRNLPEKELLLDLEDRIAERAVNSIISIVKCFSSPPELLILLLRSYEYADLRNAIVAAMQNERTAPGHTDLGKYQTVRFKKWPDVKAMVEGTEFEFLLNKRGAFGKSQENMQLETILDRHYYNALWKSLSLLGKSDKQAAENILSQEISLRNSSWVLRLRTYYGMQSEEVKLHLIDTPVKEGESSLPNEVIHCLDFPLDDYSAWSSWRWKKFLNHDAEGRFWHVNPRYFQNAASIYLYRLACSNFHMRPFSLDTVFCFFKIKQFEEDILTSNAEGLGMGLTSNDTLGALGVAP